MFPFVHRLWPYHYDSNGNYHSKACSSAKYLVKIIPNFLLNCWISAKVLLEGKIILTEQHSQKKKKSLKDFL